MLLRNVLRSVFATFFLIGVFANGATAILMPEVYATFAQDTFFPLYSRIWDSLVYPHIQLWLLLLVLFELTLCVLLLLKGQRTRLGLLLGAGFMFLLVPFWWDAAALFNLWFGLTMLWLSRSDYPFTIIETIRSRKN